MKIVEIVLLTFILAILCVQLYFTHQTYLLSVASFKIQEMSKDGIVSLERGQKAIADSLENQSDMGSASTLVPSEGEDEVQQYESVKESFVFLKPFLINLEGENGRRHLLRLKIVFDVVEGQMDLVVHNIPLIMDQIHVDLRQKTIADFKGEIGMDLARSAIESAVKTHVGDNKVNKVILQEMFIQ